MSSMQALSGELTNISSEENRILSECQYIRNHANFRTTTGKIYEIKEIAEGILCSENLSFVIIPFRSTLKSFYCSIKGRHQIQKTLHITIKVQNDTSIQMPYEKLSFETSTAALNYITFVANLDLINDLKQGKLFEEELDEIKATQRIRNCMEILKAKQMSERPIYVFRPSSKKDILTLTFSKPGNTTICSIRFTCYANFLTTEDKSKALVTFKGVHEILEKLQFIAPSGNNNSLLALEEELEITLLPARDCL
ncbi:MAG: hypothetical protein WC222_08620 [Parachlamydiales bacterium]